MKILIAAVTALTISMPAFGGDIQSTQIDLRPMPAEVKANIEELRQYGNRFEKVIAAIEAEWTKPMWVGDADCEVVSELSNKAGS